MLLSYSFQKELKWKLEGLPSTDLLGDTATSKKENVGLKRTLSFFCDSSDVSEENKIWFCPSACTLKYLGDDGEDGVKAQDRLE